MIISGSTGKCVGESKNKLFFELSDVYNEALALKVSNWLFNGEKTIIFGFNQKYVAGQKIRGKIM